MTDLTTRLHALGIDPGGAVEEYERHASKRRHWPLRVEESLGLHLADAALAELVTALEQEHERAERAEAEVERHREQVAYLKARETLLGETGMHQQKRADTAEAERDALLEATNDLRAFLRPGDRVKVQTPGRRGSVTFYMGRFADLAARYAKEPK